MLHRYVVERNIPGVGALSQGDLAEVTVRSNEALRQLAPGIQWVESYVAGDGTYCVYLAESEDLVRRHSEIAGFPISRIVEVPKIIDPTMTTA